MYVEELRNEKEWEDFVCSSSTGTFYHNLKWKDVLESSFPYRALYLVIRDADGKLVGVSPGFIKRTFGASIYDSIPASDYGGPIIESPHIPQASCSLLSFLARNSLSKNLSYARFRVISESLTNSLRFPMSKIESKIGVMEIDLSKTPTEFLWSNIFSANRRKKFRQMERRGFQTRIASTRSDLQTFYDLYYSNMIHIGANPYPFSFMENIWEKLCPSNVRIWILEDRKPLAAKLLFRYGRKSFSAYVGIDRDQNLVNTHLWEYLTWSEVKKAEEEGLRYVSLGSTPSDCSSKYFSLKSSMGCVFYPQTMIWCPVSSLGRILTQTRSTSVSLWRIIRPALPTRIVRVLENRLGRL